MPDVGVYRSAVDDGTATREMRERVFGHVEVGVDVGVEGVDPLVSSDWRVSCGLIVIVGR